MLQAEKRDVRDRGDCIDIAKALLENDAVEDELRKAKVHGNLIGIHVMQRHHRWATERSCIQRHGIGQMNQVGLQLSGQAPEVCDSTRGFG